MHVQRVVHIYCTLCVYFFFYIYISWALINSVIIIAMPPNHLRAAAGVDGAFELGADRLDDVRVHAGVHVRVHGVGRAADEFGDAHDGRRWRGRRQWCAAARTLLDGVRVRAARYCRGRVVRGDRPLAADGRGRHAVRGHQGDGVRGQRDGHVPDARARGRARVRGRGHGAVPDHPAGDDRGTHAAPAANVGRVRRPDHVGARVRDGGRVRRVVRHRADRRRRRPRVSQRVRRGPARFRRPAAVAAVLYRHRGRRVPVPERRGRGHHRQALRPLATVLAARPNAFDIGVTVQRRGRVLVQFHVLGADACLRAFCE